MSDYKVKQIKPNHADHIGYYNSKFLDTMIDEDYVIAQPKYDGERMLIHINNGEVYCTSRRHSKKTDRYMENQDKLPILQSLVNDSEFLKRLDYTVIDCEAYSNDWSTIVGILHSLPERAIELQEETAAKFAVFDCLWFDGEELTEKKYFDRLSCAVDVIEAFKYDNLHLVQFVNPDGEICDLSLTKPITSRIQIDFMMNSAIEAGFEGIVVKSFMKTYYDKGASLKCKKFETVDVVVCGYVQGRGKYSDTIGALQVGYYDPDKDEVIRISNVNCSTDAERNAWRDNWEDWKNTVIEVLCQEVTERSLRHPRYVRRREDKDYKMCTKETIFK